MIKEGGNILSIKEDFQGQELSSQVYTLISTKNIFTF